MGNLTSCINNRSHNDNTPVIPINITEPSAPLFSQLDKQRRLSALKEPENYPKNMEDIIIAPGGPMGGKVHFKKSTPHSYLMGRCFWCPYCSSCNIHTPNRHGQYIGVQCCNGCGRNYDLEKSNYVLHT